jgi:tripartite-type tricarboxylate transporter receptor subunit TctC
MPSSTIPARALLLSALVGISAASTANAQTYPSGGVKLIVPVPAGGVTDTMARIVAQRLTEAPDQQLRTP